MDFQSHYYDKVSKKCWVALAPWFYLYLKTGGAPLLERSRGRS